MTTIATAKAFIKSISIHQLEGRNGFITPQAIHTTWKAANEHILRICADAPSNGTYLKCAVEAIWDGSGAADKEDYSYEFRYDAAAVGCASYEGLVDERIKRGLLYAAGLRCPAHMTDDEYQDAITDPRLEDRKERATAMLKALSFDDAPTGFREIPQPSQDAITLAREAAQADKDALRSRPAVQPAPVIKAAPVVAKPVAPIVQAIAAAKLLTTANPSVRLPAAPTTATKKPKRDPVDSLPPTAMQRRIKSLLLGAQAVAKDACDAPGALDSERALWTGVLDALTALKNTP